MATVEKHDGEESRTPKLVYGCLFRFLWNGMDMLARLPRFLDDFPLLCCTSVQNMIGVVRKTRASVFYCLLLVVLVLVLLVLVYTGSLTCFSYCLLCVFSHFSIALRYAASYFELLRLCMCVPGGDDV